MNIALKENSKSDEELLQKFLKCSELGVWLSHTIIPESSQSAY